MPSIIYLRKPTIVPVDQDQDDNSTVTEIYIQFGVSAALSRAKDK